MKNILKRITAVMLTATMILSVFPLTVLGNNLARPTITNIIIEADNTYSMTLNWNRPTPAPGDTLIRYHIHYWNLTNGESFNNSTLISVNQDLNEHPKAFRLTNLRLEKGSLYNFRVIPVYSRPSADPLAPPITIVGNDNPAADFIFLTDIPVEAIGETDENSMTVNFKVPSLSGTEHLFTHYEISFAIISNGSQLSWGNNQRLEAGSLEIDQNGWASHTFSHPDLIPGRVFAIQVQPFINNTPSSPDLINSEIVFQGRSHTFSRSNNLYLYDRAVVRPELRINVEDLSNLSLEWDLLGVPPIRDLITGLEIFRTERTAAGAETSRSLAFLSGHFAHSTTRWLTAKPEDSTRFWFEFRYDTIMYLDNNGRPVHIEDLVVKSRYATYDPSLVEFTPYRPNIYEISDNRQEPFNLNVTWEAFLRSPLSSDELVDPIFNGYLDKNLTYRIWVTNNRNNFALIPNDMVIEIDASDLTATNIGGRPFYSTVLESYVAPNGEGGFEEFPFEENNIYFIRIEAIRNDSESISQPAYGAHYIIPINNIPIEPNMLSRPPLRIKNVDGIDQITQDSITIEWEEQWFEVYNEETDRWYSAVGIQNGNIVFGDIVSHADNILMNLRALNPDGSLNIAITRQRINNALSPYMPIPIIRMIDLTGVSYQVHTVEFSQIEEIGHEEYLNDISSANTTQSWVEITPSGTGTLEKTISTVQNPSGDMEPSTSYVIFIRPFKNSEAGNRIAFFPSFVAAATLSEREDLEIVPVVPVLHPVRSGDTYLVVRWQYIPTLNYEIRYSENRSNYPQGGTLINSETIRQNGNIVTIGGREYVELTIPNLFPNTPHYIWIRSLVGDEEGETTVSQWSNFIEMTTGQLQPPQPPRGLGIASQNHVNIFNRENGTDYMPIGPNHIIVEWMRNPGDTAPITAGNVSGEGGIVQALLSPQIPNSYMVKFNELVANRRYYVRAKTRVVISRGDNNTVIRNYTYIVQLSLNNDFLDVVEIEVPTTTNTDTVIYMDSDWTQIGVYTSTTDDEYDGNVDPDTVPLPDTDFEIIYDAATNTLTHRFRSNQVDAYGNRDNHVDQRFISRLVQNRVFVYDIDVSRYGSRTVRNRVVEVPFGIIESFDERQIDFKIVANNLTVTIPHGSLVNNEVRQLPGLNRTTRVLITISEDRTNLTNQFISTPHRLTIDFIEGNNSIRVTEFNKPLILDMAIPSLPATAAGHISGYISNSNTGGWQMVPSNHQRGTTNVNFTTNQSGTYGVISSNPANNVSTAETLLNMQRVNTKLRITDMELYDENRSIHANQFNQIIAAVARRDSTVKMNVPLSNNDFVSLGRAGMLVSGDTVSRQAGINSLVRLYEVMSGYPVTMFPSLNQTSFADIINADEQFQTGLLKADSLGFYRGTTANPSGNLTMGDLMHILDIILMM